MITVFRIKKDVYAKKLTRPIFLRFSQNDPVDFREIFLKMGSVVDTDPAVSVRIR